MLFHQMINLDWEKKIKKLDKGKVLQSIKRLPEQIEQSWQEVKKLNLPQACYLAKNIVISGMGGSSLGGRIIDSLITDRVRVPVEVFTEYHLPNYVSSQTLVIVSSYSGNTEEALSMAREALKKNAKIFVITTGGKLAEFLRKENLAGYILKPRANPSKQPRMGLGYSIAACLSILARCEFLSIYDQDIQEAIETCQKFIKEFGVQESEEKNLPKRMAKNLYGGIPVLIASEHLVGSAHTFKNQLNESSKTFSVLFDIPELNHHLMEGLRNPAPAKKFLNFLFLESKLYSPQIRKRYAVTKDVVEKNEIPFRTYLSRSDKKLEQIFEILVFGSFVSFYLAMLYNIDPLPIPWVDYFKQKLDQ